MEISLTQQALLYLLNCAVNERIPEELPHDVDFEGLYKISKFHSVSAMISYALDKGGYLTEQYMSSELIQKWAMARIHAMRKNLMFDGEREQILQHLEEIGCWYMPLKGVILKEMSPDVGMREMSDNDILFDKSFRKELKKYMVERGYEVKLYGNHIHDLYKKPPVLYFEMHTELFSESSRNNWFEYYKNVIASLKKDSGNQFGYHFTDEDFYIYIVAHTYKHYKSSGTGIRSFVDSYVYLKNKKYMNWQYISKEVSKIRINKFESEARSFVQRLFYKENSFADMRPKDEKESKMLSYILDAGTYGTTSNRVEHDILDIESEHGEIGFGTKVIYCIQRLFPGMEYMRLNRPFLCKYKILIPFFWVYRLITLPITHRKRIWAEIKALVRL